MRNLILFVFICGVSFTGCKKSNPEQPSQAPSPGFALDYMEVEENLFGAYLYLHGNFGDSTTGSKVKVGNTLVDGKPTGDGVLIAWTPFHIKLSIGDPDDDTGAGFVSVINGGKQTNQRMLNVWEISMLYKEPDEGTIIKEVRFNAILRADANPHRAVTTFSRPSSFSSRSEAYWAIGGQGHSSYPGGGMTVSLENRSGMVIWNKPEQDNTNADNNFQSVLQFKNGSFEISNLRMHKKNATRISGLADGSPAPYVTGYDFRVQVLPLNEILTLQPDNNGVIKAGSYTTGPHGTQYDFSWEASEAVNHMHNFTLEWPKVAARFATNQ